MLSKILKLQEDIYKFHSQNEGGFQFQFSPRIYFSPIGETLELIFYGEGFDDDPSMPIENFEEGYNFGYCAFLEFLKDREIANKISKLKFYGPDAGANGTRSWDFSRLIDSAVTFPILIDFEVALTDPGDHNISIIELQSNYEESGVIAKLFAKMPQVISLRVPSAPDKSFFEVENHSLRNLVVQAGYDHQNFIDNLANSGNLTELMSLDFTEKYDPYNEFPEEFTSFESYKRLFQSAVFDNDFHFILRNSKLTKEQLFELQKTRPIQFMHINANAGCYVSHLNR
jgi:hypothetical protein